jgi:CubicO group peptidase (beta-lactamase class C family)
MKKTLKYIVVILLMGVIFGGYYLYVRLPIINGYASKNLCSCVFVSNRTQEQAEANELNFSFIKYTSSSLDTVEKTVTSSFFGFRPQKSFYNDKVGCALVNNEDNIEGFRALDFEKEIVYYSEDSTLKINTQTENPKLKEAINHHFTEKEGEPAINTTALLVVHNNELIAERYAKGFNKDNRFLGWSMAKSIMSSLVGILVKEKGLDINKPIDLAEWSNDDRKDITLNNVLQMSTGIEWVEDYGSISDVTKMLYTKDDVYKAATTNQLEYPVGSYYEYSSGSSNILSGQIRSFFPTQEDYLLFPYRALFSKLGTKSMLLETDPTGLFIGSSYAWATARDWCRYGMLYEQEGEWNGEQILPVGWTEYTSKAATHSNGVYGAQFWLHTEKEFPDVPSDLYFADGFQGQRVFILPSKNLVVVRFGLSSKGPVDFNQLLKEIIESLD